jgi:hypothetical protein
MKREKDFSENIKLRCLLWSDRHCCVCGKACGLDIEVAHIDPKGPITIENAIPACYNCHAALGRYFKGHPRGNKYRFEELRKRRNQIYERYTRHLVPEILPNMHPRINEIGQIHLPTVGFSITPLGHFIPARAKIIVRVFLGGRDLGVIPNPEKPYYCGGIRWSVNPGYTFGGNFSVPQKCVDSKENLILELRVTVIDPYDREHDLLPVCFTYVRQKGYWFMEPTAFSELKRFARRRVGRERGADRVPTIDRKTS